MMEALRTPLAVMPPLWVSFTAHPSRPVVLFTRDNINPADYDLRAVMAPSQPPTERLTQETAIAVVAALHCRQKGAETEMVVMGPEAEALVDLQPSVKTNTDITSLANPKGWQTPKKIGATCAIAEEWLEEMALGLKAYVRGRDLLSMPKSCVECACRDAYDAVALKVMVEQGIDGLCREFNLEYRAVKGALKKHKEVLLRRLETACDAWAIAYVLHCTAKIVSPDEMTALARMARLGIADVESYCGMGDAIGRVHGPQRERLARKIIAIVGNDAEEEVRGEFNTPRPALKLVQAPKEAAMEVPKPAPAQERLDVPAPPPGKPTLLEQVYRMAGELGGIPASFIARCFREGYRDQESIIEKFTSPFEHRVEQTGRHAERSRRQDSQPQQEAAPVPQGRITVEDSLARMRFNGRAGEALREAGVEAGHITLALYKVFGYPNMNRRMREERALAELRRHLGGTRSAEKAAESAFRFMHDYGMIKDAVRAKDGGLINVNGGAENPVGREILAEVRERFRQ